MNALPQNYILRIYTMYVRRKAMFSSMIKVSQTSFLYLLLLELDPEPGVPLDEPEVSNYAASIVYCLRRVVMIALVLIGFCCLLFDSQALAFEGRFDVPLGWSDENGYSVTGYTEIPLEDGWEHVHRKLKNPVTWCRISLLVPDVRACQINEGEKTAIILSLRSGGTEGVREIEHKFRVDKMGPQWIHVVFRADRAAMGVRDAGLSVVARQGATGVELELEYGLHPSIRSRLATSAYLVGEAGKRPGISYSISSDGIREYVTGVRALMERNAMRYFLAVLATLETDDPVSAVDAWYEMASRYKADLPEQNKDDYAESRHRMLIR